MTSFAPPSKSTRALTATHWGVYEIEYTNGVASALRGFSQDENPSPIGFGMLEAQHAPCRIQQPMVRQSYLQNQGPSKPHLRGREPLIAVDWDTAEVLVCQALSSVRERHGNQAIYAGSYGWASAGRFHHAQSQMRRFLNLFGGNTYSVNTYSHASAEVIMPYVLGNFRQLLSLHTSWKAVAENARLVVAFGGLPLRNAQVNSGGVGAHLQEKDMQAAHMAGVQFVNVSPIQSDVDAQLNPEWVGLRPNTDVALMLGLAHTLITEKRHNPAFLQSHCVGFEPFEQYVLGKSDGIAKNAQWAAGISGVDPEVICNLARRMAKEKTIIALSWSLTRVHHGEHNYWLGTVLAAMLGQIGRAGCGVAFGFASANSIGSHRRVPPWTALPQGKNPVTTFIPVARIGDMLLNPQQTFTYNGKTYTYPDIRMVYWVGGNPFHHHQDLNRLIQGWRHPASIVVHEPWWTPTARFADIVLPTTTPLERNDLSASSRDSYFVYSQQVSQPYAKARNDHHIFAKLAQRLGFGHAFTQGRNEAQWLLEMYQRSQATAKEHHFEMPDFEEFCAQGYYYAPPPPKPVTMLEAFGKDPIASPLSTPSGKIEIFSKTIAGFKLDDCPPMPMWLEPAEWLGSPKAKDYPLHLLSPQPAGKLHSQWDHAPQSQHDKIEGRAVCSLHPQDAKARGLVAGDMVRVFNARGACMAVLGVDKNLLPAVACLPTGAWLDVLDANVEWLTCKHGNPNVLTPDLPTSGLSQGPSAHTCLVQVELWQGPIPPITAFTPPTKASSI